MLQSFHSKKCHSSIKEMMSWTSAFSLSVASTVLTDCPCLLLQAEYFYEFLSLRSLDKGIMADPTVNVPLLGTVPHKASGGWSLPQSKVTLKNVTMMRIIFKIQMSPIRGIMEYSSWGDCLILGELSYYVFISFGQKKLGWEWRVLYIPGKLYSAPIHIIPD